MLSATYAYFALLIILSAALCVGADDQTSAYDKYISSVCISNSEDQHESWRSPEVRPESRFFYSNEPWSEKEQDASDAAVWGGYTELKDFANDISDDRIFDLWDDLVEAFVDMAYSGSNWPALQAGSLREAARVIKKNGRRQEQHDTSCKNAMEHLDIAQKAHILSGRLPDDAELRELRESSSALGNRSINSCDGLEEFLDVDPLLVHECLVDANRFEDEDGYCQDSDRVWDWLRAAGFFVDLLSNPLLDMPDGTGQFVADVWAYLGKHNAEVEQEFIWEAFHVTHAGLIPTGYGRHQLLVSDAPWIYKYIRQNFYRALEEGSLDLFAEFVDFLRQYGCTEENDLQVRHGARYLLYMYNKAGRRWINHHETVESQKDDTDYGKVHKPWTAVSGLRRRVFEPITPDSYGDTFQAILRRWYRTTVHNPWMAEL